MVISTREISKSGVNAGNEASDDVRARKNMLVKVKFVKEGEQARVKLVPSGENMQVMRVESGEELKVKAVAYGEDFKVKLIKNKSPLLISYVSPEPEKASWSSSKLDVVRVFRQLSPPADIRALQDRGPWTHQ